MKRIQSKENGIAPGTGMVPGCYESPSVLWCLGLSSECAALCASGWESGDGEGIDWDGDGDGGGEGEGIIWN